MDHILQMHLIKFEGGEGLHLNMQYSSSSPFQLPLSLLGI